jgi:hypothetical protein
MEGRGLGFAAVRPAKAGVGDHRVEQSNPSQKRANGRGEIAERMFVPLDETRHPLPTTGGEQPGDGQGRRQPTEWPRERTVEPEPVSSELRVRRLDRGGTSVAIEGGEADRPHPETEIAPTPMRHGSIVVYRVGSS